MSALYEQTPEARLQSALAEAFAPHGIELYELSDSYATFHTGPSGEWEIYRSKELTFSEIVDISKRIESEVPDLTLYEDSTESYVVLRTGPSFKRITDIAIYTYAALNQSDEESQEPYTSIVVSCRYHNSPFERFKSWLPW